MAQEFAVIGKSVPRKDAYVKVTGRAVYVDDIKRPNQLHAKVLRSPHPHARIVNLDTSKAEALPGVKGILTYKDVPQTLFKWGFPPRYILNDTVYFVGDEVAIVAAETEEIAEEAVLLIDVEYEVLPAVFSPEESIKPGAPLLSDMGLGKNVVKIDHGILGDIEKGFREADVTLSTKSWSAVQRHEP